MNWDPVGVAGARVSSCPVIWRVKEEVPGSSALLVEREGVLRSVGYVDDLFLQHAKAITAMGVPLAVLAHLETTDPQRSWSDARSMILKTVEALREHGIRPAGFFCCTHLPGEECTCSHPLPGLLHVAAASLKIDLRQSVYIGASIADLEAGIAAGVSTLLVDLQNTEHYAETFQLAHKALTGTIL